MIRKIVAVVMAPFVAIFYRRFKNRKSFDTLILARYLFFQKILGNNRKIPWPVHWTSQIKEYKKIDPGDRAPGMSLGCYIDGRNGIKLGKNVWIGPGVSIISMNHDLDDYNQYRITDPIRIGDNSWLGAHSIILPSVVLGEHTIVAAGAVVSKSFPEGNQVLAGNPAKQIRKLDVYKGK